MAYTDKIRSHAAAHLAAGETIVGAARVLTDGRAPKLSVEPAGADSIGGTVQFDLRPIMALALTDRRLLFFARTGFNRLDVMIGVIDRDRIAQVDVTPRRLSKPLRITFRDGGILDLVGVKADPVEDLAISPAER